ncbi:MAG: hypothetical protein GXP29_05885 [Planctomycetes bacterium]|nr:hypothetical protein [Planctomycetota bacterium]
MTSRELPYAFHEAGHAAVRLDLNLDVLFIELGGEGDEAGQCVSYGGPQA